MSKTMKASKIYHLIGCVLILLGLSISAGETENLIEQAERVSRRGKVADTVKAYAKVFAAKDLTVEQRAAAHIDIARVMRRGRSPKLNDALAEYKTALAIKGLGTVQRDQIRLGMAQAHYRTNYVDRRGSYHTRGIDEAQRICEAIVAAPDASGAIKVDAYNTMAECLLDKKETAAATAALQKASTLPGLKPTDKERATFNLAKAYRRQLDYHKATSMLQALLPKAKGKMKRDIENEFLKILILEDDFEGAIRFQREMKRSDYSIADFCMQNGQQERGLAMYQRIVDDLNQKENLRWQAFEKIIMTHKDFNIVMRECNKYLDTFTATNPSRLNTLLRFYRSPYLGPYYFRYNTRTNPDFLIWLAEKLLPYEKLRISDRLKISEYKYKAYLDKQNTAAAIATAKQTSEAAKDNAIDREYYQVMAVIMDPKTTPAKASVATKAFMKTMTAEKLPILKQIPKVDQLAKVAVRALNHDVAATIGEVREALMKVRPRRSLNCLFVDDAPQDISAWLASSYITDPKKYQLIDRKYGNNLKSLLATDAAITGRNVTSNQGAEKGRFNILCDANGIHFFLLSPNKNPNDVADGLQRAASYEIYFAPGSTEPYYCYLVSPSSGSLSDGFHTMYKNRYHKKSTIKDKTLYHDIRPTKLGIATYFRVPWIALYNKLPEMGDKYEFEVLHWANGGFSWGGSKSVHNRSSFGDLIFSNMTAENRNKIKRRLIAKAHSNYKKHKSGRKNGILDFWEDPELGDPAFYNAKLRGLVAKLDTYGKQVNPGMTFNDVELLFEEAVPFWMEIEYIAADLRSDYLEDKWFTED